MPFSYINTLLDKSMNAKLHTLIGITRVRSMLGFVGTSEQLEQFLTKNEIIPIGKDDKGTKWSYEAIEDLSNKLKKESSNIAVLQTTPKNQDNSLKLYIDELAESIDLVKKQNQSIYKQLAEISAKPQISANALNEATFQEIRDFITSFLSDIQRGIMCQIDTVMTDIDEKLNGHLMSSKAIERIVAETKQRTLETQRTVNSFSTNNHQTNLATREEVCGAIKRIEQAVDQSYQNLALMIQQVKNNATLP